MAEDAETIDTLFHGRIVLHQRRNGYRFTEDALLLADWARNDCGNLIDLGTGCGVIPIILGRTGMAKSITGLEIQPALYELARKNTLINHLENRVDIIHGDIRRVNTIFAGFSFENVITNPPYINIIDGNLSPVGEKASAKHETLCNLKNLLDSAVYLLSSKGTFRIIFPNSRLPELISMMTGIGLTPKKLKFIHEKADKPSKVCLVAAVRGKNAKCEVDPPMIMFDGNGQPTSENKRIFESEIPDG